MVLFAFSEDSGDMTENDDGLVGMGSGKNLMSLNTNSVKEEGDVVSCVSIKSNCSLKQPIEFNDKSGFSKSR